jgi:hypothetical protein
MRIVFYTDQVAKQEQRKDLPREADLQRLVEAVTQPKSNHLQKIAAALQKAIAGPTHGWLRLRPVEWKVRS